MDAATEVATEAKRAADSALGQALSQPPKPRRKHRATKPQLLTRDQLDQRSNAAKQFDAIADGIAQDLGGEDQLSTVQRHLVEAFAGAAIHVNEINARLLLGEQIDIIAHAQAIGVMVRVASRIGIERVPRNVGPTLADAIRQSWSNGDA